MLSRRVERPWKTGKLARLNLYQSVQQNLVAVVDVEIPFTHREVM